METVRDCKGKVVCKADGRTGVIERMTAKERILVEMPVGGKYSYETASSYTLIERINSEMFFVTSYPNN